MKRSWTALAVALMAIFAVAGCNDYGNTFQNNTGAALSFLSPAQISACSANCSDFTLTVNGNGFVLKTVVQWNGKTLTTTVPVDITGAALGNVVTSRTDRQIRCRHHHHLKSRNWRREQRALESLGLRYQSSSKSFARPHRR